jgi:hypothetical protein
MVHVNFILFVKNFTNRLDFPVHGSDIKTERNKGKIVAVAANPAADPVEAGNRLHDKDITRWQQPTHNTGSGYRLSPRSNL